MSIDYRGNKGSTLQVFKTPWGSNNYRVMQLSILHLQADIRKSLLKNSQSPSISLARAILLKISQSLRVSTERTGGILLKIYQSQARRLGLTRFCLLKISQYREGLKKRPYLQNIVKNISIYLLFAMQLYKTFILCNYGEGRTEHHGQTNTHE